jgi:hypothetical protein
VTPAQKSAGRVAAGGGRSYASAMDLRVRLFAFLVAAMCAVGWVPTSRLGGSDDGLRARDGIGTLPLRRQQPSKPPIDRADDDAAGLPAAPVSVGTPTVEHGETLAAWRGDPPVIESQRTAQPRGPPSIA